MPALYNWKLRNKIYKSIVFQNDHHGNYFVKPCYHWIICLYISPSHFISVPVQSKYFYWFRRQDSQCAGSVLIFLLVQKTEKTRLFYRFKWVWRPCKLGQNHQNVISHYALPMVYLYQYGLNLFIGSEEQVPYRLIHIATFVYDPGDFGY